MGTLVVVGAGPLLGRSIARAFGKRDFRVALIARRAGPLAEMVEQLKAQDIDAAAFPADITSQEQVGTAFQRIRQTFGDIDALEFSPTDWGKGSDKLRPGNDPVTSALRHSHFGVAVTDIETSARFYTGALGFQRAESYRIDDGLDRIMELDGVRIDILFLRRPDATLELLQYRSPQAFGPRERRSMNQFGFTHISFWVDDLEQAMANVEAFGGTVHAHTRTSVYGNDLVYCTDPDGVRVELMQPPPQPVP